MSVEAKKSDNISKVLAKPVYPVIMPSSLPFNLNTLGKLPAKDKKLDDIFEDFEAFRKKNPGPEDEKKEGFFFVSREEATTFFKMEASKLLEFLFEEYVNDVPKQYYYFSCGDGELYHGKLPDIIAALENALSVSPDNEKIKSGLKMMQTYQLNNPTVDMRQALQSGRETAEMTEEITPPASLSV